MLAKNLGKFRHEVVQELDADELINWMAYEMTCNSEFRDKAEKDIALERSKRMDDEERSKAIKEMFKQLGANNGSNK